MKQLLLSKKYPKDFLAAPTCEFMHDESVSEWEHKSPVPIKVPLQFMNSEHVIFNYAEFNDDQNQLEMRTFDYTHILNNLHSHISNSGFHHVRSEAFLKVSEKNHDVLPRAIVELKLD